MRRGWIILRILVCKVLSMAIIQSALCSYRNCRLRPQSPNVRRGRSRESLPLLTLTPPNHTHLYGVKCTRRVDSQTQHGLPHIHPKMGSTVESRWRVRAAGKPSDEPPRKGKTQSLTEFDFTVKHLDTTTLPGEFTSYASVPLCTDGQSESFTPLVPPFYLLSCSLPAATLTPKECIYNIVRDVERVGKYALSLCCMRQQSSWSQAVRITFSERRCRFEMLFEIFRWNLTPREVNDEGCRMRKTCSCGEAVPLNSFFGF